MGRPRVDQPQPRTVCGVEGFCVPGIHDDDRSVSVAAVSKGDPATLAAYADADAVAAWAQTAVAGASELGLVNGRDGARLAPEDRASRAEATVMLERLMDLLPK